MKRKLRIKKKNLVSVIIIVILFVFLLNIKIIITKIKITGTWTTDNNTVYEFKINNKGKLIVPLSEYKFKYIIKNRELYIDFEDKRSDDSKYKYQFKNNKLILSNSKGIFTFVRK